MLWGRKASKNYCALLYPLMKNKVFVPCMKGLEATTGKRLLQVFREEMGANTNVAVWVGPGHVQDFVKRIPNCMLLGCENIDITKIIVNEFNREFINFLKFTWTFSKTSKLKILAVRRKYKEKQFIVIKSR